jgi:hypothetical protein
VSERDPDELADSLEQDADNLEQQSERLGDEVQDARQDWERKRADASVPGAVPSESEEIGAGAATDDDEDEGRG